MRAIVLSLPAMLLCTMAAFAGSFQDNGNGTVTDLTTNLMWQQCAAGYSGAGCLVSGPTVTYAWEDAITYCSELWLGEFNDWRLPNVRELSSLVDDSRSSPAVNIVYFPNTQSSHYWSSTTYSDHNGNTTSGWFVHFSEGSSSIGSKTAAALYVRCVRGQ